MMNEKAVAERRTQKAVAEGRTQKEVAEGRSRNFQKPTELN
jgi:hypothetical protein